MHVPIREALRPVPKALLSLAPLHARCPRILQGDRDIDILPAKAGGLGCDTPAFRLTENPRIYGKPR
jgi:hypothetical protein